jgi:uncharacterized membrane protein YfcA
MEILGYIASILIGVSLGLVGSGGSILTVPVLVYMMHFNPSVATTSSLFIVGSTSLVGGLRAYSKNLVDLKAVAEFGISSVFSIFITRYYLLQFLPDYFFTIADTKITKEIFLMVVFAILMLAASITMIRSKHAELHAVSSQKKNHIKTLQLILLGLLVGVVTGMLGAGGGFLIIPSLVLFLKLPMKIAVGTSLFIIAINSLLGFLFSLNQFAYNWKILLSFTVLSVIGLFTGLRLSEKISGASLKKGFGWFILAMSVYIIIREFFFAGSSGH